MERWETTNLQLKAKKGMYFLVEQSENDDFIVTSVKTVSDTVYSKNYVNSPILDGYKHVCGKWNTGFVIENISNGYKFVWIPVGSLDSNGTLDGKVFNEKFGRRNYRKKEIFSKSEYHEPLTEELLKQFESVKKYGGFYVSQDLITKQQAGFKCETIFDGFQLLDIKDFDSGKSAKECAKKLETRKDVVTSHLLFGAEYDSMLEWILTSNSIDKDSKRGIVNFACRPPQTNDIVVPWNKFSINNIYNFGSHHWVWTQERAGKYAYTVRGHYYNYEEPCGFPYIERQIATPYPKCARVALWIK